MKRLYVGNLSWSTTEDDLRVRFGNYGPLYSVRVITDRDTGKSKGFGFVEFEDAEDAARAREAEHGTEMAGRTLRVDAATQRDQSTQRDREPRGRSSDVRSFPEPRFSYPAPDRDSGRRGDFDRRARKSRGRHNAR